MKMLMLSDIHGRSKNLETLEKEILIDSFDHVVLLGDLYNSIDYKKIVEFMNRYKDKLIVIKGNCDTTKDILLSPVKTEEVKYLNVDGLDFYFTHGNKYNYYNNDTFSNGVLVYGHEHIPYIKQDSDMVYVNTGSLSLPRDDYGATYGVYEDKKIKIYQLKKHNLIFEKSV